MDDNQIKYDNGALAHNLWSSYTKKLNHSLCNEWPGMVRTWAVTDSLPVFVSTLTLGIKKAKYVSKPIT